MYPPGSMRLNVFALLVLVGCYDEPRLEQPSIPSPCDVPLRFVDGDCVEPGFQDDGCPAGAKDCVILDAPLCDEGLIAIIGGECEALMACAEGTWGDLPLDATTQHVDINYQGGNNDGSAERPWRSISAAVTQVTAGGLVAIAAGTYDEDVVLDGKPVRLWGKCPQQVEIVGTGIEPGAIFVQAGADGSEIGGMSIMGVNTGVLLSGSSDVLLDSLWVHDGVDRGVEMQAALGPTSIVMRRSLIENNRDVGIANFGSMLMLDTVVVRATQPESNGEFGRGLVMQVDPTGALPEAVVEATIVEKCHDIAVLASGTKATFDGVIVRDTQPRASDQRRGRAFNVQVDTPTLVRSEVTIRSSVVERNYTTGVFALGATLTLEGVLVRDTFPRAADGLFGRGISIETELSTFSPGSVRMVGTRIENNPEFGVLVLGSQAEILGTLVLDTSAGTLGVYGDGVAVVGSLTSLGTSIVRSQIENSERAAHSNFGAASTITGAHLLCATFDINTARFIETDALVDVGGETRCGCPEPEADCVAGNADLVSPSAVAIGD
jgi:hypothetical protein